MKINVTLEIEPFKLPIGVHVISSDIGKRQDGLKPKQFIPLADLDIATVEKLCDDFKERVMAERTSFKVPSLADLDNVLLCGDDFKERAMIERYGFKTSPIDNDNAILCDDFKERIMIESERYGFKVSPNRGDIEY